MLKQVFSSSTHSILQKSMDTANLRNEVIANNIANVDTPDFKRSEVVFEDKLKELLSTKANRSELQTTNPKHIQLGGNNNSIKQIEPTIHQVGDYSYRNDKNNVNIDTEMAKLAKNKINYDALTQSMSNEIRLLRIAITGRG
ncbi:Flagellar basal-body rod protein FlgB [Candidatus Syntrophocurvum alkaliphilum]|uniref:Flagellar basal body rod protein FlgB n=1 Tax=Candidatus Syntrophocurvum alkaliphilum TaxID=2293317 RepID=A0A6I6DDM8_9FIRM|nr:flagellar basal body rod protein FlgB [Candidatus Syntrophocurvum alkaliphilum]QGT99160.1 Flagellar basal-body rod protein FlgB [Candidatus Syntrophocurvum alkaliphilum]